MQDFLKKTKLRAPLNDEILKDLYYHTEQPDKESSHTWEEGYELNFPKWAHSDPEPWEKHAHLPIQACNKHIIISTPLFKDTEVRDLINLMQELSLLGFPLYCLTKEGKPERIDIQKIRSIDLDYLKDLFKKSDLAPEKDIREKIATLHKRNPKDFPTELLSHESSFVLDYFQFKQITHRRDKDEEGIPFQYEIDIPSKIDSPHDYLKLLQERVGLDHHCKLGFWLKNCQHKDAREFIKTIPIKKIKLDYYGSELDASNLEELPADIEELHLISNEAEARLNLSRFTHLKKLTIERCAITGLENLPASLQELTIKGCNDIVSLPDWSNYPHLKKIHLEGLPSLKKIPNTPTCLEEMTLHNMEILPNLTNPHGLKKLDISFYGIRTTFEQQFMSLEEKLKPWLKLCSGLIHLRLDYFSSEFFPNKTLPSHLISLKIMYSSDESIVLPDNLQKLSISRSSIKEISLPSQLRTAIFVENSSLTKIDMTYAQNLQDLLINGNAVTFSRASLPGLETLSRLENLMFQLRESEKTPTQDPPSLAHLPLKILVLNYPFNGIPVLGKELQSLGLSDLDNQMRYCNLKEHSELRHIRLYGFSQNKFHIEYPPNLISFSTRLKLNDSSTPYSIYSDTFNNRSIESLCCEDFQNFSKNPPQDNKIGNGSAGLPELKPSTMGSAPFPHDNKTHMSTTSEVQRRSNISLRNNTYIDSPKTPSTTSDALQSSSSGFSEDTYTDSKKTTLEVPYRIYHKIPGKLELVSTSLHRKDIFDRCTWQGNTFELAKSQAPEEFKPFEAKPHTEYTQEDIDKLTLEEYFVQRPLSVARAGTHRISLDTLQPYDTITHIHLPQNSRLLFNPVLHSYELEWTTQGPEKAMLEYQFSELPRHPGSISRHPGMDAGTQGTGTLMPRTSQTPPTLDKDLVDRLTQLFTAPMRSLASLGKTEKLGKTPESPFKALKTKIMDVRSKSPEERWRFCQKELAEYCREFGNVTLTNRSGWEKLEEILVEAKGGCQDRSLVFVMLCHFLGVEARLIGNDIHAFVELKNLDGIWEPLQLRGHEAQIKETDQPLQFAKPKDKKEKKLAKESPPPPEKKQEEMSPKDTPIAPIVREGKWRPYFRNKVPEQEYKALSNVLEDLMRQTHPAITVGDAKAARDFCEAVSHSFSEDHGKRVLYLESPKDLHAFWTSFKMDETGAHGKPGPLQTMLEEGHVVMINWAGFNRTQMAAYKSLMDDPPTFLSTPVPADKMHLIHLMTPETQGCTAFTSRLKAFKWPQNIPWPQPSASPSDKKEDSVTIDLYGDSSRWESSLVGSITPTETGLAFRPKKLTELASENSKPLCINLVDVPKKPEFEAFMTRLNVENGFFMANGEKIPVPPTWRFQYQDPPKDTKLSKHVRPVSPEQWLSQDKEYDRCFLNSGTLSSLEEQHQLQAAETSNAYKMVGRPGWLQSDDKKKVKQLVQTHPLTAGEKRKVLDLIAAQKEDIEWVDLTKLSERKSNEIPRFASDDRGARDDRGGTVYPSMKALDDAVFRESKDRKVLHKNQLLQTSDPDFVAETLVRDKKNVVTIPIQTITRGSDLLESIDLIPDEKEDEKKQRTFTKKLPRFTYHTKSMLETLRAGKTVVLHGHLSDELYRNLQTLFAPNPQLKLSTGTAPEPIPGQLIILTEHMPKETHLARHTQSQGSVPQEALWPAYKARLGKEKIYDKNAFERLKLLYTLATQCLREESPQLSYAILKQCLVALKKSPSNDNPIKPWFQHEEPDSSAYAQLNVFAKVVLGPTENPTVRAEKLNASQDIWKQLNCLNPTALRLVMFGKKNPTLKDYQTLNTLTTETLTTKLNTWLEGQKEKKEYKSRPTQADPYQKTMAHMRAHLNACGAVVLKGPPGSGKTWAAYQYCEEVGSPIFLANDAGAITRWKEHKPKTGEKAVLIVDEANLKRRGAWEHLSSLISQDHQIIFTRNPNSYGGRVTHPILQKTPTVPVKKWTSAGLLTHILMPLCQKVLKGTADKKVRQTEGLTAIPSENVVPLPQLDRGIVRGIHTDAEYKTFTSLSPGSRHPCRDDEALGKSRGAGKELTALNDEDKRTLKSLIKIYEYVQTLLPPNRLSIRDLQQLTLRWLQHPQRESEPQRAAYEACHQEWGLRFGSSAIETAFINKLQTEFPVIPAMPFENFASCDLDPGIHARTTPARSQLKGWHYLLDLAQKNWPEDFYLINPQKKLLAVMAQDLQLAEDCQKFQGVDGAPLAKSGLLIEGPSGFGKSSLIRQFLLSTGHRLLKAEELSNSAEKNLSKCFIQFTLSGDIKKDRDLLRTAFKKGCKVILDELNLDPLIETELNHLLTGKTEAGEKGHPGFFVFATQNDSQMEGRKSVSPALLNRLHVLHTPECSERHLSAAVQSALPHFSKEEQREVAADYSAEARQDPAHVNFRTLYQGLKEIRKEFPDPYEVKSVHPEEARERHLEGQINSFTEPRLPSKDAGIQGTGTLTTQKPAPPLSETPEPPSQQKDGSLVSYASTSAQTPLSRPCGLDPVIHDRTTAPLNVTGEPPRREEVANGVNKFGLFSSPEVRKRATLVYLPFFLSLVTFSMSGVSIAAANKMELGGMLKPYPDYASQYFQPDIKRGEMIAFAMIIAAMVFLVVSVYNHRKAKADLEAARSVGNSR